MKNWSEMFWEGHGFSRAATTKQECGLQPLRDTPPLVLVRCKYLVSIASNLGRSTLLPLEAPMYNSRAHCKEGELCGYLYAQRSWLQLAV